MRKWLWRPAAVRLCGILPQQSTTLLEDKGSVFRDPAVSWDGKRIVFARRSQQRDDDYHLYELILPDTTPRQLTTGEGVADYEAAFLPDGERPRSSPPAHQHDPLYRIKTTLNLAKQLGIGAGSAYSTTTRSQSVPIVST